MNKFYLIVMSLLSVSGLKAQNPGGVGTNLALWLKADNTATLSPSTGSLNSWTYSNNSNQFTATVGSQPTVAPSSINFLPSIAFDGTQLMVGPSGPGAAGAPVPAGSKAYSVFAVWSSTTAVFGANERVWAQRPNSNAFDNNFDGAALWVFPNGPQYGDQPEISPFTSGLGLPYAPNTTYVSQMNFLAQDANDLELIDQSNLASTPVVASTDPAGQALTNRNISDAANILGARSTVAGDEPFFGNLAELIIYDGSVSGTQRSQIFSYLSIKYGISTGADYVSSGGVTIWDATANASYNNFVFGLGQDNGSGLLTTQSNSAATGSATGGGQTGKGNIVLSSPSALTDQGFMMVGSNNAGFTETTANLPPVVTLGSERLPNQWLVQNTGSVGLVNLSFDFTGITTTGTVGTTTDFRLMVDEDGDGDFTTGITEVYTPTSFNGQIAQFQNVNLGVNPKVVLAILSNAGAGTPLPVTWVNFTAKANGPDVDLNWTVGANENAKNYQVQHSTDGVSFTSVGEVSNEADVKSYSFTHSGAGAGTHYYRILETDLDGKSFFSKTVSVILNGQDFGLRLINNPGTDNVNAEVELSASKAGNAVIGIWNLSGARVATIVQAVGTGATRISLPLTGLPAGTYAVKIQMDNITHILQVMKL